MVYMTSYQHRGCSFSLQHWRQERVWGKSNQNFSEEIGRRDFALKTGMKLALMEGCSPAHFGTATPREQHLAAHFDGDLDS